MRRNQAQHGRINAWGSLPDESGKLVRAILDLTGWTQARLVAELRKTAVSLREPVPTGLTLVTVNRWKQGRQTASTYYVRLLRRLYTDVYRRWASSDEARIPS